MGLLAGLEHVGEALAILEIVVGGEAVAESVHLSLAWVHLLRLILLLLILLGLLLFLRVTAVSRTHQSTYCLVGHF